MLKCKLKEIRLKEFMFNCKEMSEMLNVPYTTYCAWENCTSFPKLEQAYIIADKLNKEITCIWHLDKN